MLDHTQHLLNGKPLPGAFVDYNPFAGIDAIVSHVLAVEDGAAAVAGVASGYAAATPPPLSGYLESKSEIVTKDLLNPRFEVRPCGCKSFFCPHCCIAKGLKLRQRLIEVVRTFKGMMMLTFTIDPQLFASPLEALQYVQQHRCIGVTIQRLCRDYKLLHSRRYFCVIEWQENGWPHWHVLVDASCIPFEKLCEAWNKNHADWEARIAAGRPGFGSVRFSKPGGFASPIHAARYATAYLVKYPKQGYPEWVTAQTTRAIHRYQTSRGFWSDAGKAKSGASIESSDDEQDSAYKAELEEPAARTISAQVASCGSQCNVFLVHDEIDDETGELTPAYRYAGRVPVPLAVVIACSPDEVNEKGTAAIFHQPDKLLRWRRELFVTKRGLAIDKVINILNDEAHDGTKC